ncbi:hypothetical protein DPMN_194315 [Dreissena polymorpha]|uniref:Uncharacterized protein n=1 Tax=Dreissena polymorpha TaxID=45954 RepID=A0A9D3Y213_DREPO|nr:hypothetical protein DPMN_194315 [Dreissena polymorpha]
MNTEILISKDANNVHQHHLQQQQQGLLDPQCVGNHLLICGHHLCRTQLVFGDPQTLHGLINKFLITSNHPNRTSLRDSSTLNTRKTNRMSSSRSNNLPLYRNSDNQAFSNATLYSKPLGAILLTRSFQPEYTTMLSMPLLDQDQQESQFINDTSANQ